MSTQDRPDSPRPAADGRTAYVVLGMHRSGTSATTQLLAAAGAQLPEHVMPGDEHNAKGYFEPWKIALLNDERLRAGGSAWDDAFAFPFRPLPRKDERVWLNRAADLFAAEYRYARYPLLKDPRVSVLMPFWRNVLDDLGFGARVVIPVRHPLAVAGSLARRDDFAVEKSLLVWTSYMLAAEAYTRDLPRAFISYDRLLTDWRGEVARIEAAHGAPLPRLSEHSAASIDSFLTPELRHNAGAGDLAQYGWAGALAARALAWFEAAAADRPAPAADLDAAAADLDRWRETIGALVTPVARDFDQTRAELRHLRAVEATLRKDHERDKVEWLAELARVDQDRAAVRRALELELETLRRTSEVQLETERREHARERSEERRALEQELEVMRRRWAELSHRLDSLLLQS